MSEATKFSNINGKDWFEKDSEREPLLPQKLVFLKKELTKHQPAMLIRSTEPRKVLYSYVEGVAQHPPV